ncbi:MAG: DUF1653 domain-containing protein [Patescibacteria group bacterium]|nr:DUF1653 domain-containing protein [Patescibacteria group bacterium]
MLKPGVYRHYKGKQYKVLGVALHTETREKMVLYKALYDCPDLKEEFGDDPLFVRPYNMFVEEVEVDGIKKPRFEWVREI